MKRTVMLALLGATVAAPAQAQTLWRGFTSGMTVEQARAADPRAVPNPRAASERLKDGAACELVIEAVEVETRRFRGCLYFRDGRLIQVALGDAAASHTGFRGIVSKLSVEHGPEFSRAQNGRVHEARWQRRDNTSVQVMFVEIGQPFMRIVYAPG